MPFVSQFRSSLENPQTPLSYPAEWLLDIFNGGRTDSGIRVSEMTALQVTTVLACVHLVSGAMGFLDLRVYERQIASDKRVSKRVAYEHDLFDLLHYEPNDEMSAFTFRRTLQAHALLWGNLYAEIQRDSGNRAVAIWPRNPARTRPYRLGQSLVIAGEKIAAGSLVYKTTEGMDEVSTPDGEVTPNTPERVIPKEDMVHIPGLALDGRLGQSTVQLARQALGLALATEKFGAKFFGNGARSYGVLQHPAALSAKALNELRKSIQEAYGGENVQRPMILEEGMTWKETSTKPNEGQFLETRMFQVSEICRVFGVPPHMVAETEKTNRANTEQVGLEFVTFALSPWLKAWEQELKRKLFPRVGRNANRYFAMFDTRPLTMPDAEARRNFYNSGKQWGWLSSNDVREMEHLNPIEDASGDGYWMPINMQDMESAYSEPAQGPGPADPAEEANPNDDKVAKRFIRAYFRLFRDAFGRVLARPDVDPAFFERAFMPVLETISEAMSHAWGAEEPIDTGDFLRDYAGAMRLRIGEWRQANGDADKVAERELVRAVRAIWIDVQRRWTSIARARKQFELEEATA